MADLLDRRPRRVPQLDKDYATCKILFKAYLTRKDLWDTIASTEPPSAGQADELAKFLRKDNNA